MRSRIHVAIALSALSLAAASPVLGADAVTQCGTAQLKALNTLFKVLIGEATRACGVGSAANARPVDVAKLTAAVNQANAQLQGAIAQFGLANCFQKDPAEADDIIASSQRLADQLCLTPPPGP